MILLDLTENVTPGWLPLLLVIILGLALVLLFLSMRRHMKRIDVPVDPQHPESAPFEKPKPVE